MNPAVIQVVLSGIVASSSATIQYMTLSGSVSLNPLPPCPIPLSVLQAIRSAPDGTPAQISLSVDLETLETCVRALLTGKSVGTFEIPREFYKYCQQALLNLLRAATNALFKLTGERSTVYQYEWMDAIVASLVKQQSALKVTEFWPIENICRFCTIPIISPQHCLLEDVQFHDERQ
jgi:hypothetical protein